MKNTRTPPLTVWLPKPETKNLDSKKVSFYLKPGNASDRRHLETGV